MSSPLARTFDMILNWGLTRQRQNRLGWSV